MKHQRRKMPYFDFLLGKIGQGDLQFIQAFGRHVHWGYWSHPNTAVGSIADFAEAAERLSCKVCDAAGVKDGMRVLDAGCGFGGTMASLNDRFSNLRLVGLNIDSRQLHRARDQVEPKGKNTIGFVTGDACRLPFEDESFDAVLAVECIFHFPSRIEFMKEARRVLRPGGQLALSDFVPRTTTFPLLILMFLVFRGSVKRFYGKCDDQCTLPVYKSLAHRAGLSLVGYDDITANTVPTYKVLRRLTRGTGDTYEYHAKKATQFLEWASRAGWLRYAVLSFFRCGKM